MSIMISSVGLGIGIAPNNSHSQFLEVMTGHCIGVVIIVSVLVVFAFSLLKTPLLHRSVAIGYGAVVVVSRVFVAEGIIVSVFIAVVDVASGHDIWPRSSHCIV